MAATGLHCLPWCSSRSGSPYWRAEARSTASTIADIGGQLYRASEGMESPL
jgi:hypothetical protein